MKTSAAVIAFVSVLASASAFTGPTFATRAVGAPVAKKAPAKAVAAKAPVKVAPKAVVKVAPKAVVKAAPKAVVKAAPKAAVKAAPKPVVKKAAPKPVAKAAPKPAAKKAPRKLPEPVKFVPLSDPNFAYGLVGSLPPAKNFDPLGFSKKADKDTVMRYRECEIMHGRFAQMAFLGFVVPEKAAAGANWGDDFLAPSGKALDALESSPQLVVTTLLAISALEFLRLIQTTPGNRVDARVESIGWRPSDPVEFENMQVRELQNGRLAMLAFAGEVAQELVNGKPLLLTLQENDFVSF